MRRLSFFRHFTEAADRRRRDEQSARISRRLLIAATGVLFFRRDAVTSVRFVAEERAAQRAPMGRGLVSPASMYPRHVCLL